MPITMHNKTAPCNKKRICTVSDDGWVSTCPAGRWESVGAFWPSGLLACRRWTACTLFITLTWTRSTVCLSGFTCSPVAKWVSTLFSTTKSRPSCRCTRKNIQSTCCIRWFSQCWPNRNTGSFRFHWRCFTHPQFYKLSFPFPWCRYP